MKKIFFLLFILISCSRDDKKSANIDFLFSDKFNELSQKQKKLHLDSLCNELNNYRNDSIKLDHLFNISAEYYYLNDNQLSFVVSKKAYEIAQNLKDTLSMGRALYYMGDCFTGYQKDSAYYFFKESEKILAISKNFDKLAKVHYNKAHLLYYEGNYIESEIEVAKALNHLRKSKKTILHYRCYSLQGSNLLELGEVEKAIIYFNEATNILKILKEQNKDKDAFYNYNVNNTFDLCSVYEKQGEYSKAIDALKKTLATHDLESHPDSYHVVLGNLAYYLMKNNQLEEAHAFFVDAIELDKKQKNVQSYLYKILGFGEYHLMVKDTIKAKELFTESLDLSRKLKSNNEILQSLVFLEKVDFQNALKYKNEYIHLKDSLANIQRINRDKFARIEYETQKVEDAYKILSKRSLVLLLFFSVSITLLLVILLIRHKKSSKREKLLIKQKEMADEEINNLTKEFKAELLQAKEVEQNRISKELHDSIVNQIYGIRMILGSLNNRIDTKSQKERLKYIKELHALETNIRTISHQLNHDLINHEIEFNVLIEQLIENHNHYGVTIFSAQLDYTIPWNNYSSFLKINIYRIIQESLINVIKHAQAKKCYVKIFIKNSFLNIEIEDDGIGFNQNKKNNGIGFKNIKERSRSIQGDFSIIVNSKCGTSISLKIKL